VAAALKVTVTPEMVALIVVVVVVVVVVVFPFTVVVVLEVFPGQVRVVSSHAVDVVAEQVLESET
jgi:hypothetical protein